MVILEFSTRSGTHVVSPSKGTKATPVILSGCRVITHENKAIHSLVLQLLRNTPYSLKINVFLTYLLIIISGRAGGVGRGSVAPLNTNMEGQSPSRFGTEKHFYGGISQYLWHQRLQSAHFQPSDDSRTTYEAPQSRTAWKTDYGHTRYCEDCKEVCILEILSKGMRMAEWKMSPTPPPRLPHLRFKTLRRLCWWIW